MRHADITRSSIACGMNPILSEIDLYWSLKQCCTLHQGLQDAFGDVLPEESVLQKSEFLLPLDERTRGLYWNVLHPDWDKGTSQYGSNTIHFA